MSFGSCVEVGKGRSSVNLIVACDRNRVMGRDGRLPWYLPEDWAHFRRLTQGGLLVMGRICFEEMRSLDAVTADRNFCVLSRSRNYDYKNVRVFRDMDNLFAELQEEVKPIWICGGEHLYERAIPLANYLYMTELDAAYEGDRYFPDTGARFKRILWRRKSAYQEITYTFYKYA